jgi:cellobiose transport system permease protein
VQTDAPTPVVPAGTAETGTATRPGRRSAADGTPTRRQRRRDRLSRADSKLSPYLYIAPFFVLFGIFGLYPLVYTAWVSLHDWELASDEHPWSGLENYSRLVSDPVFWNALWNTFGIFLLATVPQLTLALFVASLLNRHLRGRTFFRLSVILPMATSIAAVSIVFSQLFSRDFGLVNWLLGGIGVGPIEWQAAKWSSWSAIAAMVNWRWTGYNALIYLAAMQAIPRDLYEAAAIDGASAWKQLTKVTIPLLRPTIVFTVILSTIGGFQLFTEPLLFNSGSSNYQGGSLRQSQTVAMYVYENAFIKFDFGYASAVAWVLFLIILLAAAANYLAVRRLGGSPVPD